jgi:PQQ-dependent dehydrogenase (methanol/ethanol family)
MKHLSAGVRLMVAAFLASFGCARPTEDATRATTARIMNADREPEVWLTHGRTYGEQRFSPLEQIRADTVGSLGLAWTYEMKTPRGASATPLVDAGVMYVTSAWSVVYALDAETGRELWVYDPQVDRAVGTSACCDVVNRGVALDAGRVFVGVLDGRLVALDAASGKVVWETLTVDRSLPYTITGAPRVANGLVFIGNGGAEYGVRGYVSAYDAGTGELRWRFYTVPGDPAKGPDRAASDGIMGKAAETWTGEWWTVGGGGTVWDAIVYDPDFDQVIIGVGNGSPWNQQVRSPQGGDNLFLSSIVALDAKSGTYKWHYQTTPGDTWDFTATQHIVLADLTIDGTARKVAMQAPKNGFFYVVDRSDGRLISAAPLLPMFKTRDTPPGVPLSWAYAIDPASGRPVENPEARYSAGSAVVRPSPFGAHNWHPMSFHPETGLVYIPVQDMALDWTHDAAYVVRRGRWNTGAVHAPLPDDPAIREAIRSGSKGFLIAWDPVRQREAWRVEHSGAWNGGTLTTAGGLVFQGTVDGRFVAFDAASGRQLWEFDNQIATLAGPMTYRVNGEQYVAVLAGYGSVFYLYAGALLSAPGAPVNGRVYVFKRDGSAPKPVISRARTPLPQPPAVPASAATIARGSQLYQQFCAACHGVGVISAGVVTDLRRSRRLADQTNWQTAVTQGIDGIGAMPKFAEFLTPSDAEAIRAYVARQADTAFKAERAQAGAP